MSYGFRQSGPAPDFTPEPERETTPAGCLGAMAILGVSTFVVGFCLYAVTSFLIWVFR